ncbi:MAG: hypothetical protein J0G95_14370 [Rhizobiales bacterium]|nr:hypothetical protein [Hyphomicrobiales bacterium]
MQRSMLLGAALFVLTVTPASAQMVSRESEITSIRLGQHILVDDGSCPTGQIKEITGTKLTPQGVATVRKCIERRGARR